MRETDSAKHSISGEIEIFQDVLGNVTPGFLQIGASVPWDSLLPLSIPRERKYSFDPRRQMLAVV
jgi:hypothetical protein